MPLQRDPSTGKIKRNATTGKLVRSPAGDPCCCGASSVCAACPDASPRQFNVTFDGVILAVGCTPAGTFFYAYIDQASLSGTFTLTKRTGDDVPDPEPYPGECVWQYDEDPGVTVSARGYAGIDCTGEVDQTYGFHIRLVRHEGFFTLSAWLGTREFSFMDLFLSESPGGEGCNCIFDMAALPSDEYGNGHGSDGTAHIEPVPEEGLPEATACCSICSTCTADHDTLRMQVHLVLPSYPGLAGAFYYTGPGPTTCEGSTPGCGPWQQSGSPEFQNCWTNPCNSATFRVDIQGGIDLNLVLTRADLLDPSETPGATSEERRCMYAFNDTTGDPIDVRAYPTDAACAPPPTLLGFHVILKRIANCDPGHQWELSIWLGDAGTGGFIDGYSLFYGTLDVDFDDCDFPKTIDPDLGAGCYFKEHWNLHSDDNILYPDEDFGAPGTATISIP